MRGSVGRDARLAALVIVPLVLLVGVFVLLPTAIVVHDALTLDGRLGVDALRRTVTDAERVWFVETTVICAVSAVIAGVLGLLLALAVVGRRRPRRLHRLLTSWAATRSRIGGVPLAFAFVATIGVQGVLTRVLVDLGVPVRRDDGTVGFWPMVLVYLYFLVPLMLLVVLPAAASVPRTWSEAAAALGCSRWRYWRCVGTPVLAPAAAGGVAGCWAASTPAARLRSGTRTVLRSLMMSSSSVKGMRDLFGAELAWFQRIEDTAARAFGRHGYREIRTPVLEHTEVFKRSVGDSSDIVNKEMYEFVDKGGRSVTLRPENTAGVVRAMVQHKLLATSDPQHFWYVGPMFRYERMQAGRYRQFWQIGAESFGVGTPESDAESLLRVSVLDPKSGDPVTVETNPLRWADLLPTAFRTGDYTVSIETVGEPDPSASTSDRWTAPAIDQGFTIFLTRRTTKLTSTPFAPRSSPIDVTITCFTFVFFTTSASVCAKFSSTTITSAPESTSWCSSSRAV